MILLKLYRYSPKYLERFIKYVPIICGTHIKHPQTVKILSYFNFEIELLSGKLFPPNLPVFKLIQGSIYFFCPSVFVLISAQHNKYMQVFKTYIDLQIDIILNSLANYMKYFLFVLVDTKFIPIFQIAKIDINNYDIVGLISQNNKYIYYFEKYSTVILNYLYQIIRSLLYNIKLLILYNNLILK